jgi:hypothetical protein
LIAATAPIMMPLSQKAEIANDIDTEATRIGLRSEGQNDQANAGDRDRQGAAR